VDHPRNSLTALSGIALPQVGRPAAFFYFFEHPMPYASAFLSRGQSWIKTGKTRKIREIKNEFGCPYNIKQMKSIVNNFFS
jgi:hypothetical protein